MGKLCLCLMLSFGVAAGREVNLMPQPASVAPGQGRLVIGRNFRVALSGYDEPRIRAAVERMIARLSKQTGMPLAPGIEGDSSRAALIVECERAGEPMQSVREDESYKLEVTPARARLSAVTPVGVLRGLETFLQLVDADAESFAAPAVVIDDRPRFPWRGLLIDSARHFMPLEVIERNLDGMAALKMNVLHWHLTDDQGFRFESRLYPKLHGMGSDGLYYTQDQVRHIVNYAQDRGIRVVPEFDMPGHTTSWLAGHPELGSAPGPYAIERTWGIMDPCLDPSNEEVYKVLDGFLGEAAALFPDEYLHIGGDEVNGKHWEANLRIQAFMRDRGLKDNHDLQAYFNQRVQAILAKHGKRMAGWDEILHPNLPKDVVVQSWRGQKSLAAAARQGYTGILSFGYYLDLAQPARAHYAIDPMEKEAAGLSEQEKSRVLGGEACMWAEMVTAENVDTRIWPRAAAVAERLWSPQEVRDPASMYRRMEAVSRKLEWLGLTHRSASRLMLQRLAGNHPVEPLAVFAAVLEPVKGYARSSTGKYTQQTPLNRLVDSIPPESDAAREFRQLVGRGAEGWSEVRSRLAAWRDNYARVVPLLESSFLLRETLPLARDIAELAAAGLEALDYLERGAKAPASWLRQRQPLLDRARKPQAELLILIAEPVRTLVERAAGGG